MGVRVHNRSWRVCKSMPNTACSGLAGTQGTKGRVINPPAANAHRWASGRMKFKIKNRLAGDCVLYAISVLGFSVLQVMFHLPA